ncbi:hypothetical protein GCU60_09845 [Blastococcus saxobsidens]|uniref:DUF2071 domain-containing protein n=1 Tax=Blastococcus saxobsidens TaxID=138336 RepID=A0A6L9W248_9ACTN|nr:DUF2071 domain-containing protein [Blastococcus saxobsidens]NEK86058.1 hypothetical protein [Blastococcus saxobsidens]
MRVPRMTGEIERRLLVNYRVDPAALRPLLPERFRPQLVEGAAVAGICLIRLGDLRPRWTPAPLTGLGLTTENAAHRIAVEWDGPAGVESGVYIPRRDTDSRLTVLLGGRAFPGVHSRARFTVAESDDRLRVAFRSDDGRAAVDVAVAVEPRLEGSSLFPDVAAASRFFEQGTVGWSPAHRAGQVEGVRLDTTAWRVDPGRVLSASSSFFDDTDVFPAGSAQLDCALVMRKVPVDWSALPAAAA